MPLFDPELSWTRPRSIVLGLLVAALVLLAAIAPSARAQEVPSAPPPDTTAPATADGPVDAGPPPEVTPTPEPSPEPSPPPPPPEVVEPPLEPPPPPDEPSQPASPKNSDPQRDTGHAASPAPSVTVTTPSPPAAAPAPTVAVVDPQLTAAPLGWDVYDDALFAETVDGDKGSAVLAGGGPPAVGGLGVLGPVSRSIAREKHKDAAAGSRPNATPVGGSGPGGGGPGHGPSMGLAGGGGGGGAGIALLMLLGLACAWSLLAPRDRRAFRTSTATWRPSAYVPPIEHPG